MLRAGRRRCRGAAAAEPLLRREPRRAGLPRHLLRRADRVGGRARGRTPAARRAGASLLLAAAGLLRPDAWVLSGVYWLWCAWPAPSNAHAPAATLALAAIAPLVWVGARRDRDRQPAVLADRHRRAGRRNWNARRASRSVLGSLWTYADRIDKLPVLLGGARRACRSRSGWRRGARSCRSPRSLLLRRRVPRRGRRRRVGDRPLPARRRDRAAAVLRGRRRRLGDARAGLALRRVWIARRGRARALRRRLGGDARSASRACAPRSPTTRTSTRAWRARCASPAVQRAAAALPAAVAAQQQADPRRALDPRQRRPARHRRPQPGARRRRARARTRSSTASRAGSVAVYPLGSASSSRRSSTSATTRATRCRCSGFKRDLHEPLLRGVWQLLRRPAPRRALARAAAGAGAARRWAWPGSRSCSLGGLGAAPVGRRARGCPTPTTPTRPTTSSPHAVGMFAARDAEPALLRQPARLHLPAARPVRGLATAARGGVVARLRAASRPSVYTLARVAAARARHARALAALPAGRAAVRPRASACSRRRSRRSPSCRSSTPTWRSTTCRRSRR